MLYIVLTKELKSDPADLLAHLNLVTLLVDAGKLSDAAHVAGETLKAFPGNPEVLVMHGATHMLLGEIAEAKNDFGAALKLSPGDAAFLFLLSLADFKQGDYASAASSIKSGLMAGISSADLHYLLAECDLKLEATKLTDALHELDSAIALDSGAIAAHTLRGKLLLDDGHPRDALVDLLAAHKGDPTSRSALYNLARIYSALGNTEEAARLYKEISKAPADIISEAADQKVMQALGGAR